MRNLCYILLIIISCSCSQEEEKIYLFTSFREPATDGLMLAYSKDGYHWEDLGGPYLKPEVGKSNIMRDPSIAKDKNGTYHLVWTTEWRGGNGFGYASSKDLIHWSKEQYIPVMKNEPEVVNVWAPEIFYDEENDEFIIIWASTIPFKFPKGEEEEKNNHRMYYTKTKDFKTFTEAKLFLDPGFSVIDAVIVKRDTKDYVLVLKDNTRPMRNLKVAFATSPLGPYHNISKPFTDFLSEGPTTVHIDNEWLIYYDNYGAKNYKAAATTNFKNFKDVTGSIQLPEGHKHGTITTISPAILNGLLQQQKTQ